MYLFGGVVFLLFGSAEVQSWGKSSAEDASATTKQRTISTLETNLTLICPVILDLGDGSLKKDLKDEFISRF